MKISIACGGTGGHIFPGLATAEILRATQDKILFEKCPKCEKKSVYRKALDPRTLREMEARKIDDGPKASAPLRVTYAWQLVSMERFLQELVSERNRFTRAKIANRLATVGIYLPLSWATPPGTPARESGDR